MNKSKKFLIVFLLLPFIKNYSQENHKNLVKLQKNVTENVFTIKKENPKKEEAKEIKAGDTIRGYFGVKTSYFDKDGKPKLLNKDFKSLSFEELEHNRKIHKEKNDKETIIRYTERMIALCRDPIRIGKLRLEVADLYFDIDRFDKSGAFYSEFVKLYPGNAESERAAYRAIVSKYEETLPADKDQTLTKETLNLAKDFISHENYKKYRKEVAKIMKSCKRKLLDNELNIFNFYLNKGNIKATEQRLENIKKDYSSKSYDFIIRELEKQIDAAKNKTSYSPEYQIASNSKIFDFFVSRKKSEIESPEFLDKYKERKNDVEFLKDEKNKKQKEHKKIDYVTKL